MGSKKTMFGEPKYAYLAEIISLRNPKEASGSVKKLLKEFEQSVSMDKMVRIYRAAVLASNRAKAQMARRGISRKERSEFYEISEIYQKAADKMRKKYRKIAISGV